MARWPLLVGGREAPMVRTAARRRDRSARSMGTMVWIAAPIMLRRMKSILSHRRWRDVTKTSKSLGLSSRRRMQVSLLPFHIVASILSWLPVKSLLRFRCVCKEWRYLTYDPSFIKEHYTRARALGRLALVPTRYSSPKILLYDFGDNGEVRNKAFNMRLGDRNKYTISNPVDGLIFFENSNSSRYDEGNHYLMNMATRELAKLPTSVNGPGDRTSLGFGVDSSTGGYKLVKLWHNEAQRYHCGCKVLELGTQEWREVGYAPGGMPITELVRLNGALHWISMFCCPTANKYPELTIVAFNLKDENFRSMPLPPEWRNRVGEVYLVEWEGLLCMVKLPSMHIPESPVTGWRYLVRIWRMEDYATCRWREAHCSELPNHACVDGWLSLVGIRGHEMLIVTNRLGGFASICSYDLRTSNLRELYNGEDPGGVQFLTESLASPRYLAGNPSFH